MAKKPTVTTITSGYASNTQLNANFVALRDAFDNTLSLDGSTPNTLTTDLDLGTQDLLNVGSINGTSASGLSANLGTVAGISGDITTVAGISADVTQAAADSVAINAASANASAAAASASAASTSAANAAVSEAAAAASYDSFDDRYLGAKASNPTVDNDGDPLITGALYFNTTSNEMRTWNGSAWVASFVTLAGALIATNNLSDLDNVVTARTNLGLATVASTGAYSDLTGTPAPYADADVDTHLNTSTAVTGEYLSWNGADYDWAVTPDPFGYTAVSGATQALDVGTYNFFDGGTLTADTTLSFSSVPTQARWTYTADVGITDLGDVLNAAYTGRNLEVRVQEATPLALYFKDDGTEAYVVGLNETVFQYSLSTAWSLNTGSYSGKSFNASAQVANPTGLSFKSDGTKMYLCVGADIYQYSLSTAWDVSTASYDSITLNVTAQDTTVNGLAFKSDGTKLYTAGDAGNAIYQYSLSTAWVINTATYDSVSFSTASQTTNPRDVSFTSDGTKMYTCDGSEIWSYDLSTAWDLSTATYNSDSVSLSNSAFQGIYVKPDQNTLFTVSSGTDDIEEVAIGSPFTTTLPSSVENPPEESIFSNQRIAYTFFTADGGTTVTLINEEVL